MGPWLGCAPSRCVCVLCVEEQGSERLCVTVAPLLREQGSLKVCVGLGGVCVFQKADSTV